MNQRDFFVNWLRRFGLIHGFTMMVVYVICLITHPDAVFDVPFLGNMILFSLAGTLPGLVYINRHEMSETEWWIRTLIHYILLNILLLPISHAIGLWQGITGLLMFMGLILTVDILVHALSFSMDLVAARDINRMLQERKEKRERTT